MLPVIVKSSQVREFTSRANKTVRLQTVGVQTFDKWNQKSEFVTPVEIFIGQNDQPYQPGDYHLDPSCIKVKDNRLVVEFPRLVPLGGLNSDLPEYLDGPPKGKK